MNAVDVSLVVCTRNRVDSLKTTIGSIEALVVPPAWTVELVVVDNGSTDGTAAFLEELRCRFALRVLVAMKPGLSHARNVALAHARGRVLAWTDDDVVVDPDWLRRIANPIMRGEADAVAGQIVIPQAILEMVEGTPLQSHMGYLASTSWMDWSAPAQMVGASMAFGSQVLAKVPRFDERLGAGPDSLGFHEEGLFSRQLVAAGFRLVGVPEAIVHHHFSVSRLGKEAVLEIATKIGRSNAYMDWHWLHRPRRRFIALRRIKAVVRHRFTRLFMGKPPDLEGEFALAWVLAYHDEYSRCMREPRRYERVDRKASP